MAWYTPFPVHHLKREGFGAEVGFAAKRDRQVDVADRVCLHARQDNVEGEEGFPQAVSRDSHVFQGVNVEDVEAAASVHQYLG